VTGKRTLGAMVDDTSWDDLRVLLAVFRHGSFLAAGRALGLATSTVARRLGALEASLGRALVQRGPSGAFVEPDALQLVALAEQLERGFDAMQRDRASSTGGVVRISAGEGFVPALVRVVADVRRLHPDIHVELVAEAKLVDVAGRQADLGVRTARSSSRVLVERRVGTLVFGLFASRSYLDRRLPSASLAHDEVARHDFIASERSPLDACLVALGAERFPFRSSSDHARVAAAVRGQGIALLAEPVGRAEDTLVRIAFLPPLPTLPVYVAHHRELRKVPRIKVMLDAIARGFADLG